MNAEIRQQGREFVFNQITNPITKSILKTATPYTKELDLSRYSDHPDREIIEQFPELFKQEGWQTYRYLFAMATVASDSIQLANIFKAISFLSDLRRNAAWRDIPKFDQAQNDFLGNTTEPIVPSDGARRIQSELVTVFNSNSAYSNPWGFTKDTLKFRWGHSYIDKSAQNQEIFFFWAEGFLLTLLDPHSPLALRKCLLEDADYFHYIGRTRVKDPRFQPQASIWQSANLTWVYPDFASRAGESIRDPKEREIFVLKGQISELKAQLSQRIQVPASVIRERDALFGENEAVKKLYEAELEKTKSSARRIRELNQRAIELSELVELLSQDAKFRSSQERNSESSQKDRLDPKGYCRLLGVDPNLLKTLSDDKLNKYLSALYRAQSHVHHPDAGGDTTSMQAINEAYEFLKDPNKRKNYSF